MEQNREATYVTVRFKDRAPKTEGGKVSKRVENFFYNGGNDSRGLPILNSKDHIAFVGEKSGRLNVYKLDEAGQIARVDGEIERPVLSLSLGKIIEGANKGLQSKALEAGQGTVTGPAAADLVKRLADVAEKARVAREAEKKASDTEGAKPARRKP